MNYSEIKLNEIVDVEILKLFKELSLITEVNYAHYGDFLIENFLRQAFHPNGAQKPTKLNRERIDFVDTYGDFLILRKVGKSSAELYNYLKSIADSKYHSIENYQNRAIYMFLNQMYAPTKKKRVPHKPY